MILSLLRSGVGGNRNRLRIAGWNTKSSEQNGLVTVQAKWFSEIDMCKALDK